MTMTKKTKPAPPPADPVILEIETAAAAKGYSVADICREAGYGRASWQRWKFNKTPIRVPDLKHLRQTVEQLPTIGRSAPDRRLKGKEKES
jgi:hypothetical protein